MKNRYCQKCGCKLKIIKDEIVCFRCDICEHEWEKVYDETKEVRNTIWKKCLKCGATKYL